MVLNFFTYILFSSSISSKSFTGNSDKLIALHEKINRQLKWVNTLTVTVRRRKERRKKRKDQGQGNLETREMIHN